MAAVTKNINEVIELKNEVMSQTGQYVHFHDACPQQFFNFDEPASEQTKEKLGDFLKSSGEHAVFSDEQTFTIQAD